MKATLQKARTAGEKVTSCLFTSLSKVRKSRWGAYIVGGGIALAASSAHAAFPGGLDPGTDMGLDVAVATEAVKLMLGIAGLWIGGRWIIRAVSGR